VRGARGGGGGVAVAVGVGGEGGGVGVLGKVLLKCKTKPTANLYTAAPSGGFGHFGAGFGPNHHHEDEEEEEDDLLRQLGELVARFTGVDPLIILHQVCQWLGIDPPALPPQ
jgi:hypothetical protein